MINETNYINNPLFKEKEHQIDELLKNFDNENTPGCVVGIIQNGEFIYKKSFGMANLEYNIPITSDTKFEIASNTKQFTAVSIALLQIEGNLDFYDDIRKYIPELPDYGEKISIKNLIFHTGGLPDYTNLMRLSGIDYDLHYFNNQDIVKQMSKIKQLNFKPGKKYQYSNTGYLLLAEIVSRISGQSFSEFVKEKIFSPLGMTNSFIIDNWQEVIKNRAVSYYKNEDNKYDACVHISEHNGDMGLITTINDFLLWDQNFYHWKVGGEKLKRLFSNQKIYKDFSEDQEYGLGLCFHKYKGISTITHDGAWLAYASEIRRYPEYNTSVIIFCNTEISPTESIKKITDIILDKYIKEPGIKSIEEKSEFSHNDLEKFCGNYCACKDKDNKNPWNLHSDSGELMIRKIYYRDGNLFYQKNNISLPLIPKSQTKFILEDASQENSLIFEITPEEKIMRFMINGKCSLLYKSFEPIATQAEYFNKIEYFHKYEGKFYSKELDIVYEIKIDNNKLAIFIKEKKMSDLTPIMKDIFIIDEWYSSLHYFFDPYDKDCELILDSYRVQNITFTLNSP